MLYCSNCGNKCSEEDNYCPKCGKKLENKSTSKKNEEEIKPYSEADDTIEDTAWHSEY